MALEASVVALEVFGVGPMGTLVVSGEKEVPGVAWEVSEKEEVPLVA